MPAIAKRNHRSRRTDAIESRATRQPIGTLVVSQPNKTASKTDWTTTRSTHQAARRVSQTFSTACRISTAIRHRRRTACNFAQNRVNTPRPKRLPPQKQRSPATLCRLSVLLKGRCCVGRLLWLRRYFRLFFGFACACCGVC